MVMAKGNLATQPLSNDVGARPISTVLRALDVFADAWSFLILREAFFGVRRFEDFQRNILIARGSLTERLQKLCADGILVRCQYQEHPPRFEYRLTEAGIDFYPPIVALMQWGDKWKPQPGGIPLVLRNRTTGRRLKPIVICSSCGKIPDPKSVTLCEGPGAGYENAEIGGVLRRTAPSETYTRGRPCSVAQTLGALGDRWSLRILREAFFGVHRFEEFQQHLGIARNILTDRLSNLVDQGIYERVKYQERPDRFEYHLTQAGLELYPVMLLMMNWGEKWRGTDSGPALILLHRTCGKPLNPALVDERTGEPIMARNTAFTMRYSFGKKPHKDRTGRKA